MKALGIKNNFLGIPAKNSSYNESAIVILQAPLEKTVSYGKGTARGPSEIIKASHYVEFYDEETDRELCFEKGICTLDPFQLSNLSIKKALDKIFREVTSVISDGKFPVILGGEHSLSSAVAKAFSESFDDLSILQIDAHSDLRDSYEGSKYSHASVMKRIFEFNCNIVQVGIRAQCREESEFIRRNRVKTFYARDIRNNKFGKNWKEKVEAALSKNVFITFDVDGLDPSVISATGTPEPGGLLWDETLDLIKLVASKRRIVGFDLVELAPDRNSSASNFTAAKLVYKILNYAIK